MLIQTICKTVFILILYCFISCADCSYKIKKDYIKSNCIFKYGFLFQELNVYSFKYGIPDSIQVIRNIDLGIINESLKGSRKIYFYKENENYDWNDIKNSTLHKTLPIKMEVGKWYRIRGLMFLGQANRAAFIQLKENGELKVHGYSESRFY